jgi:hypothetical protein
VSVTCSHTSVLCVVYIYRLNIGARDAIYISLLLNAKRLDSYSTADRYAVFIGLRPL